MKIAASAAKKSNEYEKSMAIGCDGADDRHGSGTAF